MASAPTINRGGEFPFEQLQRRTVKVLALGQVLGGFGLGATLSVGALLVAEIIGAELSGLAATLSTLGAAIWAMPLANLAGRYGRRIALASGAAFAVSGAFLIVFSAAIENAFTLMLSLFLLGSASAVQLQARFAATDLPCKKATGRDLSLVVWATTIGAVIGPNMFGPGEWFGRLVGMPELTGPFAFTVLAQLISTSIFWFGLKPDPLIIARQEAGIEPSGRSVSIKAAVEVIKQYPLAGYAVMTIALSHMVMVSVMSMTPVHLHSSGSDLTAVGFTISMHIAGMYAFAPLFGLMSDRVGTVKTVLLGQVIFLISLIISGVGQFDYWLVFIGLFFLGLGWSAATVAASALISEVLPTGERTKVQGFSDTLMNLSGAFGGAVAGIILVNFTFGGLNAAALIPVVLIVIASSFSSRWQK